MLSRQRSQTATHALTFEQNTADGANVNQWSYWGGKCQLWYLESTSGSSSSSSSSASDSNYKSIFGFFNCFSVGSGCFQ
ncbi:MAG: hypothetical protein ACLTCP_09520 [Ruminococcus bicirculans (ex Wegman et al. 2014)]